MDHRNGPTRRALLGGAAAWGLGLWFGRLAAAARLPDLPLSEWNPWGLQHYDRLKRLLFDHATTGAAVKRLWQAYREEGDARYGEWALFYGWAWWRTAPLGQRRVKIARAGRAMAVAFRQRNPDHPAGHLFIAFYLGLEALARGILDSLYYVPEFESALQEAVRRSQDYLYRGADLMLAKLYMKLPPFPVSKGDLDRAFQHLEAARPVCEGKFAMWYLFLAEATYLRGGEQDPAPAFAVLDRMEREVKPTDGVARFILDVSLSDGAAFREAVRSGAYDKYRWDPMLAPWRP